MEVNIEEKGGLIEGRICFGSAVDITSIIWNKDLPNEEKDHIKTETIQYLKKKVEEGTISHILKYITSLIDERRNPSYMGFAIFETPSIEQGKPLLVIHPADMVDYLRRGVISFRV